MNKVSFEVRGPVATITLNNPEKHNAFDDGVIQDLRDKIVLINNNETLRLVILRAKGKNFSAGADLSWMKRMAELSYEDNLADARNLAALMQELYDIKIPTIARVQGAAFGGAIGLISCCDIVIAGDDSKFCLSEVKLGLAPATIGPFVVKAISSRVAKKLFLTAEVFNAEQAKSYGLIHEICESEQLDKSVSKIINQILMTGPYASKAAKELIKTIEAKPSDLNEKTSSLIASLRVSDEGQAGLKAFFNKQAPYWTEKQEKENYND